MAGFPKIPGCKIINELAEGGMSVVYLGIQKSLNRKVAIKILEPKLLKNEVVAKRFRREAKAAAYLSHSNIIQIIDVGKFRNHYYIIMEYLEDSLKERMKSSPGGKMNPQTALEIVKAIMGALEFAHSRKIYHRDIKPDNIMFRADNTPVLTDFGVARVLGFTDVGELTKSGQSMGTVYYMSPEQCQAQVDVDGRSDIYSLGAVFFEMLTGKKPYEGDNMVSVAVKHVQEPIPKLPQDLKSYQPLISKMMAKDREKRISSVSQFQQLLDKIMTGTVTQTHKAKDLNSTSTIKISTILTLKKKGSRLKHFLVKGLNSINSLKNKLSPSKEKIKEKQDSLKGKKRGTFIKNKLLTFVKDVKLKTVLFMNEKLFPFMKQKLNSFKKYPVKKKLVLGILPVVLVLVIFIIILRPGPGSIKNQDISYTSIYKLFAQDLPYHIGLSIAGELYKKDDPECLKGAQELVKAIKKIKISPEITELEEKITNSIKSGEKFNKYLTDARDHFNQKNFSKALENISIARKIKSTPELVAFDKEVQEAAEEEEKKKNELQQKDEQAYELANSENTISAYQKYLEAFPAGRYAGGVGNKLNLLKEAERKKQTVTLRSQYNTYLSEEDVQSMIKKYGFFHASWNSTGAFKGYYEKTVKNGGDLVIAYKTGLMWYNGKPEAEMNLEEAEKWIEKLNSHKYAGYADWRLPTLEEAASLLRKDKNKDGLYIEPIFSSSPAKIWTKDNSPKKFLSSTKYWIVCFDRGTLEESSRGGTREGYSWVNKHHVIPVRLFNGQVRE